MKIQKYKKTGNNENIDTKEYKPEEVKCASTNTGSDVINMCIIPYKSNQRIPAKQFTLVHSWIAAPRAHSYWTNWQLTLEYLEENVTYDQNSKWGVYR